MPAPRRFTSAELEKLIEEDERDLESYRQGSRTYSWIAALCWRPAEVREELHLAFDAAPEQDWTLLTSSYVLSEVAWRMED
ncbi:MAG TPA: hypothetical protein VLA73_01650 [Burkholderiales bacterium]|nr:hypothetical protein [Burkholderiales bacterium]